MNLAIPAITKGFPFYFIKKILLKKQLIGIVGDNVKELVNNPRNVFYIDNSKYILMRIAFLFLPFYGITYGSVPLLNLISGHMRHGIPIPDPQCLG